jgi:cyclopropane-fatty-acyl-phospholipid synthase
VGVISSEHSPIVYWADFVLHGTAAGLLALALARDTVPHSSLAGAAVAASGWALWTLLEYSLHRFVLHGLSPFKQWHAQHHARPAALIARPTLLSACLLYALVFLPAWMWLPHWAAEALSLGVVSGYLAYGLVHHATHHGRMPGRCLHRQKRRHALHHRRNGAHFYGVTTSFWDLRFGSVPAGRRRTHAALAPR